jgi:SAM-dependent methyltransferase
MSDAEFPETWYEISASTHFWFEWRFAALLGQLADLGINLAEPLRAIEVGGGAGVLRDQVEARTAWTVDLTDLNPAALARAGAGRGEKLVYDILEPCDRRIGAYDVLILFDVLEHVGVTRPLVTAAIRHLRPGGLFLVNVPALPVLHGLYDRVVGHLRRYTRRTLGAELAGTDVVIADVRYWGLTLTPLAALRKLLLAPRSDPVAIVRQGLAPPGRLAHTLLRMLMHAELRLIRRPPFGASLLLAGRKVQR